MSEEREFTPAEAAVHACVEIINRDLPKHTFFIAVRDGGGATWCSSTTSFGWVLDAMMQHPNYRTILPRTL